MGGRALHHGHVNAGLVQRGADVMCGIVRADHDYVLALVAVGTGMARGMVLLTLEDVHALELRHVRLGRHASRKHQLLRLERDLLAIALDDDGPFLVGVVPIGVFGRGAGPVVQLHDLGVHLQPVADLVLGREHRPVLREVDVGQMIVPDRVVQAERLVAVAPGIAGAGVLLDDDGGHAELAQPRAERDAALAAADDEHVGLGLKAEPLGFLVAQFLPGFGAGIDAVPGAERPGEASLFLMTFQFDHRCQKRPDLAVLDADQAVAARGLGLERDPAFGYAAGFGRALPLGDFPVARLCARNARAEHVADLIAAFHGLDIPGEGDEVAPVAFRCEHRHGGVEIACHKRGFEFVKKDLDARVKRGVEHYFLPGVVFNFFLRK